MMADTQIRLGALLVVLSALLLLGCEGTDDSSPGDSSSATCEALEIYVGTHPVDCGTSCPEGLETAYQDGAVLACHACTDDGDCPSHLPRCEIGCGPGCEDDTGGCCRGRLCR